MNPIQMLQSFMGKGGNPQQLVMNAIRGMSGNSNPMINNLLTMAQNGDSKGIEQFARNFMKEKGKDFDTEFNAFMKNFNQR